MRKVIDFIKKPLLIISSIVFAIFAVVIIAISSMAHGEKYEYSDSFFGVGMDITFTFKSESTLEMEMIVAGEMTTDTYRYEIKDEELFTYDETTQTWVKEGDIDAFEIELEFPADPSMGSLAGMELELVCKENRNLKVLSVVMMSVFGVLAVGSAVVLVLDKKGKLKFLFKNQETQASETVVSNAQPIETATPVQSVEAQEAQPVVETAPVAPEAQVEVKKETDTNN